MTQRDVGLPYLRRVLTTLDNLLYAFADIDPDCNEEPIMRDFQAATMALKEVSWTDVADALHLYCDTFLLIERDFEARTEQMDQAKNHKRTTPITWDMPVIHPGPIESRARILSLDEKIVLFSPRSYPVEGCTYDPVFIPLVDRGIYVAMYVNNQINVPGFGRETYHIFTCPMTIGGAMCEGEVTELTDCEDGELVTEINRIYGSAFAIENGKIIFRGV